EPLLPGQAAALAASLARLLDRVATEGASFAKIADLVPEGLAEHWRVVHQFLEILPQHWPRILAEEGALDAASRRNRLLERQTETWRRSPPRHPVIAAGLTGGIPAMTDLLSLVAALDQGAVILPGLDRERDAAEWSAIEEDEAHPQHLMAGVLRALDLTPAEVRDWPPRLPDPIPARGFEGLSDLPLFASLSRSAGPAERNSEAAIARRVRLIAEALRPAITTDAWRRLPAQPLDTLDGLSRYDCASAQEEAVTIALLLRRKLETPGATAALVTPDRALARRVAAELRRWDIDIDDSAGLPLNRTPPGVFLRLVLDLAASGLAPVPLLAALKHPLASGGLPSVAFRDLARQLEQAIRGPRPAPGLAGLRAALAGERVGLARFVDRLEACLGSLPELLVADGVPLSRLAAAHIEAAERLASTATETGGERLWRETAGEAAARFCHELIDAARDFPPLPGRHFPALFESLAADAVVRPVFGRHPRLAIWGLLEARLQQADLVVLGALNEGSWPPSAEHDPWMSRQMRREFGIALPERAIGIAAHDFAQALGAPEVALTRAARSEGVPTVPSRWLLRLDTVVQAVGLDGALGPDDTLRHAAELIDRAEGYRPLPPPEPRPPLAARPRKLSVTQIETWLRDPYAIYARHILGLRALDELDADPGRAELGTVIHRTLDAFFHRFPQGMPDNAEEQLLGIGREQFGPVLSRPGAWAFWWPRFARIARWLVDEERVRRLGVIESLSECEGSWTLPARGGPFTITAKADRIDRLDDGGFLLVDYKTGSIPQAKQVQTGFALQLPLEGAILRGGGFKGVSGS
ncbi:MAG TPA: double-strand break repair protein AddB, partial [Stellaceae bacterium]|nr:double-strand break repair protein AddB [Stellaceae bacterium]